MLRLPFRGAEDRRDEEPGLLGLSMAEDHSCMCKDHSCMHTQFYMNCCVATVGHRVASCKVPLLKLQLRGSCNLQLEPGKALGSHSRHFHTLFLLRNVYNSRYNVKKKNSACLDQQLPICQSLLRELEEFKKHPMTGNMALSVPTARHSPSCHSQKLRVSYRGWARKSC